MSAEELPPDAPLVEPLTRREREILGLLDQGFSAPEMAEQLTLAVSSVKWHIQHLYGKLGVSGKRAALTRAQALGLLGSPAGPAIGEAAAAEPAAVLTHPPDRPAPGESPFKGLRYFDEADAPWFFGREALAAALLARLAPPAGTGNKTSNRFLAVVGASGSGKSSIVRAGILPALRQAAAPAARFEPICLITPTTHPLEALAVALTRAGESVTATATLIDDLARDERTLHLYARRLLSTSGLGVQSQRDASQVNAATGTMAANPGRLLLVVDQFEELFTLCRGEPERQAFINNLLRAAAPDGDGLVTVLITLRADFYPHCAAYPGLREALANQQAYIGPMDAAELRQAVERPAQLGGWEFEPGLVDLILRDVSGAPGALPLLSHALLETWRHRRGRTMALRSYAESGGVQRAIATTAEAVFQSMPPTEQAIVRSIFLRLTELGEGTQDTRRRVALAELLPAAEAAGAGGPVTAVLQRLSEARLITLDEGAAEVAHEALIREWPTLQRWLADDREGLRLHRRLTEAAQEWDALERDPSELYRGPRLAQALDWAAEHAAELNPLESEFMAASRSQVEREAAQHEAQQQRELAAARGLAEAQRRRAEVETQRAAEQTQAAARLRARNRILAGVGGLALLAALAAGFFGLQANRNLGLAQAASTQSAQNLSAVQAASTQAIADRNEFVKQTKQAFANQLAAQAISVLPSNYALALLLGVEADRTASSYLTRNLLHSVLVYSPHLQGYLFGNLGQIGSVVFSPDGKTLAAGGEGQVVLWDTGNHQQLSPLIVPGVYPDTLVFGPNGKTILAGDLQDNGSTHLLDIASGQLTNLSLGGGTLKISSLAISQDGKFLAVGGLDKSIYLWDAATGLLVGQPFTGHSAVVDGLAFSADDKFLASISQDSSVRLWDVATGQQLGELPSQQVVGNRVNAAAIDFSPDGQTLAWIGSDIAVFLANVATRPPGPPVSLNGPTVGVTSIAFSPDSSLLATGSSDGNLRLWNVASRLTVGPPLTGHSAPVLTVAFSPDGKTLASGSADQSVILWQVSANLLEVSVQDPVERACLLAGRNLTHAEWTQYFNPQTYRKTCEQWPDGY